MLMAAASQGIRRSGYTIFWFSGFAHPDQIFFRHPPPLLPDCVSKGSALAARKSRRPVSPTFRADACCALSSSRHPLVQAG